MFLKNPNKYTPALGGKCTVCLVEMGKTMDGTVQFATMLCSLQRCAKGDCSYSQATNKNRCFLRIPPSTPTWTLPPKGNAQYVELRCRKKFKASQSSQPFTRTCDTGFHPKSSARCSSPIRPNTKPSSVPHRYYVPSVVQYASNSNSHMIHALRDALWIF